MNVIVCNFLRAPKVRFLKTLPLLFLSLLLVACGGDDKKETAATDNQQQDLQSVAEGWPRTVHTIKGDVVLKSKPQRIVSTSVTLTGILLAIDAPVIASGGTWPNTKVADDQGFFTQWGDIAKERNVKSLYQTSVNAEAVAAAMPDLIIVSAVGGDSAISAYDQLASIAPTIVINYDDKSWIELAVKLGDMIGQEKATETLVDGFNDRVEKLRQSIKLPPQPVTSLVYYADGSGSNVWTTQSAQGKLLQQLGFELATIPDTIKGNESQGKRKDIVQLSGENFADGLNGKSLILMSADENTVKDVMNNPFLKDVEAVKNHQVYAMGLDTFRLDYYSASHLLDKMEAYFN